LFFFLELLAEGIHLFLKLGGIVLHTEAGIPGIFGAAGRGGDVVPAGSGRFLDSFDKFGCCASGFEFRMSGGKNDEVETRFRAFWLLGFDGPVGGQEDDDIEADEGERNDGPATPAHVFVTQRNQHRGLPESRHWLAFPQPEPEYRGWTWQGSYPEVQVRRKMEQPQVRLTRRRTRIIVQSLLTRGRVG